MEYLKNQKRSRLATRCLANLTIILAVGISLLFLSLPTGCAPKAPVTAKPGELPLETGAATQETAPVAQETAPPPPESSSVASEEIESATPLPLVVAKSKSDSKKFHLLHPIKEEESCISEKCHAQAKKVKYVHAPVATGVCVVCHGKIRTNPPYGLTRTGTDLCLGCHEQQKAFFGRARFVHKPVKEGCTNCHNPHSSQINKFFLARSELTVCTNCHRSEKADPNKIPQIKETKFSHKPVSEGKCAGCHAPHASNFKKLLREGPQEVVLCFSCHKKKAEQVKAVEFKHGPIRDGMCASCHKPHGSEIPKNLKYNFVEKFYNSYDPELYELCFKCHKDTLVKDERTTYLTNFRNGDRNLHYLHVNRKKGRTCIACHEVHMGSQAMQIRNLTPFGGWQLPIKYAKTTTGGKCLESCHILKQYDREKPFKLDVDSEQVSVASK